jgi:hypothetical protein
MGARIMGSGVGPGTTFPIQRRDRSLVVVYGLPPDQTRDDDTMIGTWAIDPWPVRSGKICGGEEAGMWTPSNRTVWVEDIRWSGSKGYPYFIRGICRDNAGQPVSGAQVNLCRADNDAVAQTTVSGLGGYYGFGVYDQTTQYYVDAFRGPPAIAGATVRTLTGVPL